MSPLIVISEYFHANKAASVRRRHPDDRTRGSAVETASEAVKVLTEGERRGPKGESDVASGAARR